MKSVEDLIRELEELKRDHFWLDEDCWYSCPMSGHCCNDNAPIVCDCGADKHNAKVDAIIATLKE